MREGGGVFSHAMQEQASVGQMLNVPEPETAHGDNRFHLLLMGITDDVRGQGHVGRDLHDPDSERFQISNPLLVRRRAVENETAGFGVVFDCLEFVQGEFTTGE